MKGALLTVALLTSPSSFFQESLLPQTDTVENAEPQADQEMLAQVELPQSPIDDTQPEEHREIRDRLSMTKGILARVRSDLIEIAASGLVGGVVGNTVSDAFSLLDDSKNFTEIMTALLENNNESPKVLFNSGNSDFVRALNDLSANIRKWPAEPELPAESPAMITPLELLNGSKYEQALQHLRGRKLALNQLENQVEVLVQNIKIADGVARALRELSSNFMDAAYEIAVPPFCYFFLNAGLDIEFDFIPPVTKVNEELLTKHKDFIKLASSYRNNLRNGASLISAAVELQIEKAEILCASLTGNSDLIQGELDTQSQYQAHLNLLEIEKVNKAQDRDRAQAALNQHILENGEKILKLKEYLKDPYKDYGLCPNHHPYQECTHEDLKSSFRDASFWAIMSANSTIEEYNKELDKLANKIQKLEAELALVTEDIALTSQRLQASKDREAKLREERRIIIESSESGIITEEEASIRLGQLQQWRIELEELKP